MITLKNTVLWVVTLIALNTVMVRGQDQSAPPNIILIVADDMGYGDLSCYGQQAWSTPRARVSQIFTCPHPIALPPELPC